MQFDYETYGDGVRVTFCHGAGRVVKIPGTIGGLPVRSVGTRAFYGEGMETERIEVPPEVRRIEPHAFELCISLSELILPDGLLEIGEGAFVATALVCVKIPSTVMRIGGVREISCRLEIDPANRFYHSDGYGLFRESELISAEPGDTRKFYRIPDGTVSIAPDAFAGQEELEEVVIPASLVRIEEGTFSNAKNPFSKSGGIRTIRVEMGNPRFAVEGQALYRNDPEGLTLFRYTGTCDTYRIREGVRRIAGEAFLRAEIRRVELPESVKEIGADAFAGCTLTEAEAPGLKIRFPRTDTYLLKGLLRQFGVNGKLYDFHLYDQDLLSLHINTDRVRMICGRLENPVDLPGETAAAFRKMISERMTEIVSMLAKENDTKLLKDLELLGMVTDENADALIDAASEAAETSGKEVLAELMDYKHRALAPKAFDFSF
jgi:hypothetical protein